MNNYTDPFIKDATYLKEGVNMNTLLPSQVFHPGEDLLDELKARRISQKKFAEISGLHPSQLNEIIKGKRAINADIALQIGTTLNMPPELWLRAQMYYELSLARIRANGSITNDKRVSKKLSTI